MSLYSSSRDYRELADELNYIAKLVLRVRYLRLERELMEGANPEINTDRDTLLQRMEDLKFRPGISTRLRELDQKIQQATRPTEFRDCMDAVRIVFEELVEDAGRKAASVTGKAAPSAGPKGNFTPWKDVLVATNALTGAEGALFAALYAYLSNAGTHRLESKPEQVRITKNMAIECGLLVVGRVQEMQGNSPSATGTT